jgi:hypothetical protein
MARVDARLAPVHPVAGRASLADDQVAVLLAVALDVARHERALGVDEQPPGADAVEDAFATRERTPLPSNAGKSSVWSRITHLS